ncbi:MAG: cyclase family protein [Chloroflexi bacterium]|nr:cyclase family protein [Chloroflexota bacterium]
MTQHRVPTSGAQRVPTNEEVASYLRDRNNWGRWGERGAAGAINLITPEKRVAAARLVTTGRTISLSRPWPVTPSPENPRPAQQYIARHHRPPDGGSAGDYYGSSFHGWATTHLDALCHVWDRNGMWDGRNPDEVITFGGATYGSIDQWSDGILTRGVLLNVPKHRGTPYVTLAEPVHGWELEDIARAQGVRLEPGDALVVYSGREAYARDHGGFWGAPVRPGLHVSCLPFIRDHDIAVLIWDMMDAHPNEYHLPWAVHAAAFAYGVALLDNALLEPLAQACEDEGRYEFLVTINPLKVIGGTGSPVNPVAVF